MILDRTIALIGAPMDVGGVYRGASLAPDAVRIAGLIPALEKIGLRVVDRGDVRMPAFDASDDGDPHARHLDVIVAHGERLRDEVRAALADGQVPLVIGGDHAIACGTIAGVSSFHRDRGTSAGLIWFDAHGDMNTPDSSPSGNVHGMPLASCLGRGPKRLVELAGAVPMLDVKNCVLVGVHELDRGERALIREFGLRIYTMREIDQMGMQRVMEEAIEIACDGTDGFHLSFDVDGCDESIAPGTGTIVPGGTSWRESHLFMENIADCGKLLSMELVEINPLLDTKNKTAKLAVALAQSALGKLIY
ncbi:Arginase [Planctomycetes bacterium Pla163]|uniref:Arginase n=1 Tax=Rohdeia mirabilis TaxID=2528008 RepID=A0A518D0Y8_9BACT|nr:Arginase [Planctomycetes bacterium Pla163]